MDLTLAAIVIMSAWWVASPPRPVMYYGPVVLPFGSPQPVVAAVAPAGRRDEILLGGDAEVLGQRPRPPSEGVRPEGRTYRRAAEHRSGNWYRARNPDRTRDRHRVRRWAGAAPAERWPEASGDANYDGLNAAGRCVGRVT